MLRERRPSSLSEHAYCARATYVPKVIVATIAYVKHSTLGLCSSFYSIFLSAY
jgi:hypothetical protein